mgnify:FL=1
MGMLYDDADKVSYIIVVNGRPMSPPYPKRDLAEASIAMLPEVLREQAVVQEVVGDRTLLLG